MLVDLSHLFETSFEVLHMFSQAAEIRPVEVKFQPFERRVFFVIIAGVRHPLKTAFRQNIREAAREKTQLIPREFLPQPDQETVLEKSRGMIIRVKPRDLADGGVGILKMPHEAQIIG